MRDADRLTQWVAEHSAAVYGFLLASLRDRGAAEDLLQEVFSRAWLGRSAYAERGQARAYLLQIAQRLAIDWQRGQSRRPLRVTADWQGLEPVSSQPTPLANLERDENERRLLESLEQLTAAQRQVLLLRYYGEMSFEQIAAQTQSPLGTVLSQCRRGLAALRRLLAAER